jgi:starch-binding outer membrane protein, SusD/RagB family
MKKIYSILLLSAVILCLGSACKKILEPTIYTSVIANNFPSSDADAQSALIPFYALFSTNWGSTDPTTGVYLTSFDVNDYGYSWATSVQTDEAFDLYYGNFSQFTVGPSTYLSTNGFCFYGRLSFIARLTDLIDKINKSNIPSKAVFAAEAKTLRAYYMFILDDLYGPSNPRLDPTAVNSLAITPRLTETAYATAMENDLNDAIGILPAKYNGTANWGRVSKGVANMILLKVEMLEAGRTGDASYWTKAKTVGESLIGLGYALDPSYQDVFTTPQNNEVIFAIPGNSGTVSVWFPNILPYDAKTILGVDVTNSQKYQDVVVPWSYYDKYAAGDTRLQTLASSYINTSGQTIDRANGLKGAIPMKYPFVPNQQGFDFVLFQYSDVLLSMAEITNEISGPTTEAVAYLKQVTDRAHTIIPPSAALSHDALSDFILDERGRELYWIPGVRREDLIRHGTFISDAMARGLPAKPYQVLLPIPSDVIIQSNGIVKQNTGY